MNLLLIFFAFPIAVIIISLILQKLLKNPVLVAAFIFAIFIVITFAFFNEIFLIATFAYTILAFITAFLVSRFCNLGNDNNGCNFCRNGNNIADVNNDIAYIRRVLTEFFRSCNNTNNTTSISNTLQEPSGSFNLNNSNNNCNNNDDDVFGIVNNNCGCGNGRRRVGNCRRF